MTNDTIREKLSQHPFSPLEFRASSGKGYKVSILDLIVMMKSKVFIAEPRSDRSVTIPFLHITAVKHSGNGHHRRERAANRR